LGAQCVSPAFGHREAKADESLRRRAAQRSRWSLFVARIQMKTKTDAVVTYDVEPGSVANMPPGISFQPCVLRTGNTG
jgi:hypothetical protein